jgi:hypothetical protein
MYGGQTVSMTSGQKAMVVATLFISNGSGMSMNPINVRLAADLPSSGGW